MQISCRYVAEISSIGILAPNYVCLDTKIMILSELEAEILKISISVGHFEKWPPFPQKK